MSYGDGSITEVKRKDGTSYSPKHWKIYFYMGKGEKPRTKTITGTKADARKERDKMRAEIDGGLSIDADKMTFAMLCTDWERARIDAGKVDSNRIKLDQSRLDVLTDHIGKMLVKNINIQVVEKLLPKIRESRLQAGYRCSNSTLREYFRLLKSVLERGVRYGYIMSNPCNYVENKPPKNPVSRRSLSLEDASLLLSRVNDLEKLAIQELQAKEERQRKWSHDRDRSYMLGIIDISHLLIVRVGLATGMRLSEILQRTWKDLEDNLLSIDRSSTKSDAGVRTIALDQETLIHLLQWKCLQAKLMGSLDLSQTPKIPIFCTNTFTKIDKQNFERWWRTWREDQGFPNLLFHELRHTQATQLLANGVDIKTVQNRLGHSSASVTLNFYSHAMPGNDQKAASLIGDLFSGKAKPQARIIEVKTA